MSHLLARLRSAFTPAGPPTPDVELLTLFIDRNDQDAFTELVRRYGPMVLGVCRRTLGNGPDADDAYQATFLVLAKRAATVRGIGRVAGWLHGVATLCAKKARIRRARRRLREQASGMLVDVPAAEMESAELSAIIDEELAAIPEKYRTAVVLCELRQLTLDQAAAKLGVPRGTVASRLARGREALGKRLLRRGLFSLVPPVLSVETPPTEPTPAAHSLSREVLRTMTVSNLRWLPLAVLPLVAVAASLLAADSPKPTAPPPKAEEKVKRNATVERVKLVGIGGLMEQQAIRKDLGLTKEQDEKIDAEREKVVDGFKELGKAERGTQENALQTKYLMIEQCGDLGVGYDAAVLKLLTESQVYRLKQLSLQREGPTGLLGRYAARELTLTAEQEDKLADAVKPLTKPKLFDMGYEFSGKPLPPEGIKVIKQHAAMIDGVRAKTMEVLTDAQRKRWKEVIGEEVPTDVLLLTSGDGFLVKIAMGGK
jgi:RNA polymerase sigma factor (sigma-70 family)